MSVADIQEAVGLMGAGLLGLIAWLDQMDPPDETLVSRETMERLRATEQEPPQTGRLR